MIVPAVAWTLNLTMIAICLWVINYFCLEWRSKLWHNFYDHPDDRNVLILLAMGVQNLTCQLGFDKASKLFLILFSLYKYFVCLLNAKKLSRQAVWNAGEGKTMYTFSVTFHLACYQQAGRVGQAETEWKYVGVSGKRIRYFTPPLWNAK